MTEDFFDENASQEDAQPETFKLGEKEYTQDDLTRLVGLGEIADELENKWDTKIDRIMPKYTKTTQELAELRKQMAEKPAEPAKPQDYATLTPEQKDAARKQLADLGYGEDQFRNIVREELAAKELLSNIDVILDDAKENGQPVTSSRDLLQHMADTGIKNPIKAYKDMFESELDAIKEKKLSELKPAGMVTTSTSTAGSKQPAPGTKPKNREELFKQTMEVLSGQS